MPVTHVNRRRDTYYLHVGTTKMGKPKYWFAKSDQGDLADSIPEGYEIYENPDAQVFLRKKLPQVVAPEEVAMVREGLRRLAPHQNCQVDLRKEHIVIYHSGGGDLYQKVMRFTLIDEDPRTFKVQRWCFKGAIDDWIDLWMSDGVGTLPELVERFCRHIGRESFFELM